MTQLRDVLHPERADVSAPRVMAPLIICSGARALPTAKVAAAYYLDNGISPILVRPTACAVRTLGFASGVQFIDDEALPGVDAVRSFLLSKAGELALFGRSPGWFLQQFIKLTVAASLDKPIVYVTDGDTIFSAALLSEILIRPQILVTGEKYDNYDRLVRALGLIAPSQSCVANGNALSRDPLLRQLATSAGFIDVIEKFVLPSRGALDFSEYQIAGGVLASQLGIRRIRMFRRFDLLLKDLEMIPEAFVRSALRRYDAVAIEVAHGSSMARRIAARAIYRLGFSW